MGKLEGAQLFKPTDEHVVDGVRGRAIQSTRGAQAHVPNNARVPYSVQCGMPTCNAHVAYTMQPTLLTSSSPEPPTARRPVASGVHAMQLASCWPMGKDKVGGWHTDLEDCVERREREPRVCARAQRQALGLIRRRRARAHAPVARTCARPDTNTHTHARTHTRARAHSEEDQATARKRTTAHTQTNTHARIDARTHARTQTRTRTCTRLRRRVRTWQCGDTDSLCVTGR
jgi:hypothetical protein